MSETARYRHLTTKYCVGNGLDIGSGGDPVVPNAIQFEAPPFDFEQYNGRPSPTPIQWYGDCFNLPFKDGVLDWIYSSHLLEDFPRHWWAFLLGEWARCLKGSHHMVLIVPERTRWLEALAKGQPPNCKHMGPEPLVGDISRYAQEAGLTVISEALTDLTPEDYSILAILQKP